MTNYSQLVKVHEMYDGLKAEFSAHIDAAYAVAEAAAERIGAERSQIGERMTELRERIDDPDTLPAVHKMAVDELERLQQEKQSATIQEIAVFVGEIDAAKQCIADLAELQERYRDTLDKVNTELREMRQTVLGDQFTVLRPRSVERAQDAFNRLCVR